jgi:hypothetical protein
MKKAFIAFISIILTFNGFAQLRSFRVEVPQASEIILSDSIQSFTLLNRSINHEYKNYDERELQVEFYKKQFESDRIILDSIASDSTLKSLGIFLFESERYDVVIPLHNSIFRTLPYTETPEVFDWDFVEEICEEYNTDALLVLENLALRTVTNYTTGIDDYSFLSSIQYHYASMDFYSRSHWRIYYPKTKSILIDLKMNHDTIYWDNYAYDLTELFQALPSVKNAAIEAGVKVAYDFSKKITPRWIPKTRYYYVLKRPNIDQSVKHAAEGNWGYALENWLKYTESGNRIRRSKVMLNVALAYEMTGDIDNAIYWAKESTETFYRSVSNHYLKELLKRKTTLNQQ